jgi:protein-disulfide isomerase-like protein with CxxC motif
MRALGAALPDLPVEMVPGGLVTGPRIGPYREAAGYIRGAAGHLARVTGQAPSEAFFAMIEAPDSPISASAPPSHAVLQVQAVEPARAAAYAHALLDRHFGAGARYDDPATYAVEGFPPVDAEAALAATDATPVVAASFARAARLGVRAFPTVIIARGEVEQGRISGTYEPAAFVAAVEAALG